jgi:hypothetical protein
MTDMTWAKIVSDAADRIDFYLDMAESEIGAVRKDGKEPDDTLVADLTFYLVMKKITAEYRAIKPAAKELITKLGTIHANEEYKSVWVLAANHGNPYTGPNYQKELGVLAEALTAPHTGEIDE